MGSAFASIDNQSAAALVEIGGAVIGLAILARLANRIGFSAIPLYLLAGLAFGNGGLLPLQFSEDFVKIGADVGVLLLLFMLGIEYTAPKLVTSIQTGYRAALCDFVLNFSPGVIAGYILKMPNSVSFLFGGITYVSSSGVISKVLSDRKSIGKEVSHAVTNILVLEDLAMTLFLPIVSVIVSGLSVQRGITTAVIAISVVFLVLFIAARRGERISEFVSHQSDEIVLLSIVGLILVISGLAQYLQISAAIGAFIVGVGVSGPLVKRTEKLLSPLRDLFAAVFFLFFGLQIDPRTLLPGLGVAAAVAAITVATKLITGMFVGKQSGLSKHDSRVIGAALIPRGEFSIVIAGLGAVLEPRLGGIAAAYVLLTAVIGPILVTILTLPSKSNCKKQILNTGS